MSREEKSLPAEPHALPAAAGGKPAKGGAGPWRRLRPLFHSRFARSLFPGAVTLGMRFIRLTNPLLRASMAYPGLAREPVIFAMWHGQHLLTPAFYPSRRKLFAMVSKSADAELNAQVLERFGVSTIRGSGGRSGRQQRGKGGARALIGLKRLLDSGNNVAIIADASNGTPRDAGMGVVLLARLSGCPIVPVAVATSRRKVLENSWDRSTINLPFGRSAVGYGPLVEVPADADERAMEEKRQELTAALNAATEAAYRLVDRHAGLKLVKGSAR